MSSTIYNVGVWDKDRDYKPHDIVRVHNYTSMPNGSFYYAKKHIANCPTCVPEHAANNWWSGYAQDQLNWWYPHFTWVASYDSSVDLQPRVRVVKYGNKVVEQRLKDGLNSDLISLSLKFDKRGIDEATAISHFLHKRGGAEPFIFNAPAPFNLPPPPSIGDNDLSGRKDRRLFLCKNWTCTYNFQNNYTISATFSEIANYYNKGAKL